MGQAISSNVQTYIVVPWESNYIPPISAPGLLSHVAEKQGISEVLEICDSINNSQTTLSRISVDVSGISILPGVLQLTVRHATMLQLISRCVVL